MADFNWNIQSLQRDIYPEDIDGGVIVASWKCVGVEGEKEGETAGTAFFTPDPSSPDYTPYDDLTEEQVLGWCYAVDAEGNSQVNKEQTEAQVQSQLDWFPTTANGIPW
tara:strand:+ start:566 stop:892 length:327 start_codon:yes stop_codon:yes gene_type:complete